MKRRPNPNARDFAWRLDALLRNLTNADTALHKTSGRSPSASYSSSLYK